jgi:hypothetical protein
MWLKFRSRTDRWKYRYYDDSLNTRKHITFIKEDLQEAHGDHDTYGNSVKLQITKVPDADVPGEVIVKIIKDRENALKLARHKVKHINATRSHFEDMLKNAKKEEKFVKCKYCKGKGENQRGTGKNKTTYTCVICHGTKKVKNYTLSQWG